MMKMKLRWPFRALYLFILTRFISAQDEITVMNEKEMYASPGSDVNLKCSIPKGHGIYITQTQWTKIDGDPPRRIAVYNPNHGTQYFDFSEAAYGHSVRVTFTNLQQCQSDLNWTSKGSDSQAKYSKCNEWILHLRNVSLELTGLYECSFTTFPTGTRSSEIHLIIQTEEDVKSSVAEILLNQTLEIPCFKDNLLAVYLTNAPLKWLMKEKENEEILISRESNHQLVYATNPTIYKERIQMDEENTLKISPVSVLDNGKQFVCSVAYPPERVMKSITEVAVFAKPEISIALKTSFLGKVNITCRIRKAFPKADLLWYMNGTLLMDKSEGIFFENENKTDEEGFYERRSLLAIKTTTRPSYIHQTFRCMAVYPLPGNIKQNLSSETIILSSAGYQTTSVTAMEFTSQVMPVLDHSTDRMFPNQHNNEGYAHSTENPQEDTTTELSRHSIVPPRLKDSTVIIAKTSLHVTHLPKTTTRQQRTTTSQLDSHFFWPAVVTAMLLFCTLLIVLGIRKWCQYQKEILNRPPSFKPPPPPIKYTYMPEVDDGTNPTCPELENL